MEIKRRPLLTVYEVRRAAAAPISDKIHIAQLGYEYARLVAAVEYTQITKGGPVKRPIEVDLFAVGHDGEFTADRGIEATVKFLDTANTFTMRYSIRESATGISYALVRFAGKERIILFQNVGADLIYREPRTSPSGSISRYDVVYKHENRFALLFSESVTQSLLERTGVLI